MKILYLAKGAVDFILSQRHKLRSLNQHIQNRPCRFLADRVNIFQILIIMFPLNHVFHIRRSKGKQRKGGFRTQFRQKEPGHIAVSVNPGLFAEPPHKLRLINQNDPAVISHLGKQMTHKRKIIPAVPRLRKVLIILHNLTENPLVDFLQRPVGNKIPLQVRQQKKLLIRILCIQIGAEQIVQLVRLQIFGSKRKHLPGQRTVGRNLIQLMHKSRLLTSRKIKVLQCLLVHQMQLIHRRFLAQTEVRNHHIAGMSQVKHRIQQMGFSFPVLSADNHSAGFAFFPNHIQASGNILHNLRPGFGKILSHRPGGNTGAQRLNDVSGFHIIHRRSPPP